MRVSGAATLDQRRANAQPSHDVGPDFGGISAYRTLTERRDWLRERISAKRRVGWDVEYDQREHEALCWALDRLASSCNPPPA